MADSKRGFFCIALSIMTAFTLVFPFYSFADADPDSVTDGKYILFNDPGYLDFLSGSNIQSLEFLGENGEGFTRVHFQPLGGDPFIYMPLSMIHGGVSCDEYKYIAISVRSEFATHCQLYFGTSNDGGLNEEKNVRSSKGITESKDWETVVFYFGDHFKWNGMLGTARFDPYSSVPDGMDYMDIRWIAFVKNEADLEKLDVSVEDLNKKETFTRRPVYSTPDRTKSPREAKADPRTAENGGNVTAGSGFSPAVLITVTTVLLVAAGVGAVGIVAFKGKHD